MPQGGEDTLAACWLQITLHGRLDPSRLSCVSPESQFARLAHSSRRPQALLPSQLSGRRRPVRCWAGARDRVIESADEFVRFGPMRTPPSTHEDASDATWHDVIERLPEMGIWVAQNQTVPLSVLELRRHDPDERVPWRFARSVPGRARPADSGRHDPFVLICRDPRAVMPLRACSCGGCPGPFHDTLR